MFEKSKADVAFMEGDYDAAAAMYLDGAREGDALASFNYGNRGGSIVLSG